MARTIWKYPLQIVDRQEIEMPFGAEILSVQVQGHEVCLWALVQPANGYVRRRIFIHGTGHWVDHQGRFIDTFQLNLGALVFHAFDLGEIS